MRKIEFRGKGFGKWRHGHYVHFERKPMQDCYNKNFRDFIVQNDEYREHRFPVDPERQRILYPALGLTGEAGEVSDKVKKVLRDKEGNIRKFLTT